MTGGRTQSDKTVSPGHRQGTIVTAGTSSRREAIPFSWEKHLFVETSFIYFFMVLFTEALEMKVQGETGL